MSHFLYFVISCVRSFVFVLYLLNSSLVVSLFLPVLISSFIYLCMSSVCYLFIYLIRRVVCRPSVSYLCVR